VGCIFAELLSGKPLFPGRDEADTLRRILEFMGLPTNKTWPGIEDWPLWVPAGGFGGCGGGWVSRL
jgi:hypothetical protein